MIADPRVVGARKRACAFVLGFAIAFSAAGCGSDGDNPSTSSSGSGQIPEGIPTLEELRTGNETSPPASGPAAVPGKTVYWVSCGEATPGCAVPAAAAAVAAEVAGWDFRIIDGKLTPAGVMAGVRQAIAASPDAIVTHGVDCPLILQSLREAKDAGIPVVGMANSDCDEVEEGAGAGQDLMLNYPINDETPTNTELWTEYGRMQAQYLVRASNGEANILNVNAVALGLLAQLYYDGFMEVIETCSGCKVTDVKIAASDYANEGMGKKINTALLQNPSVDWVTMGIDSFMNLGGGLRAVDQVRASGREIHVVGGEGTEFGMQALRDGRVDAETAYSLDWNGWMAIDILNRHFVGEPQVPQGWGVRLIDEEAASELPGDGAYVPTVDFKAAYTKIWQGD